MLHLRLVLHLVLLLHLAVIQREAKLVTQILNFRNKQIKNCMQRKYLKIPKTINTWVKLLDKSDVSDDTDDLNDVIVLNIWIKRWDRYHHGKSALLEKDFNNSIEFFYNSDMTDILLNCSR